ncbi:hypothetical protein MAPG_00935 [Magnaporthiopsis poae ATCC 64411]|uniref:Uncharacterized protein n=1 Tax=Magnaporthiopsis poae (strain ATCC 64411 / 73-15) TaxID=644358 RepID=A0A0C4DMD0_MAGP6|nr:hypothetical protein MAPG_00935 [Magnaporthiopsis poae ATCC 64411]
MFDMGHGHHPPCRMHHIDHHYIAWNRIIHRCWQAVSRSVCPFRDGYVDVLYGGACRQGFRRVEVGSSQATEESYHISSNFCLCKIPARTRHHRAHWVLRVLDEHHKPKEEGGRRPSRLYLQVRTGYPGMYLLGRLPGPLGKASAREAGAQDERTVYVPPKYMPKGRGGRSCGRDSVARLGSSVQYMPLHALISRGTAVLPKMESAGEPPWSFTPVAAVCSGPCPCPPWYVPPLVLRSRRSTTS